MDGIREDVLRRAEACLLGGAIGDALGATTEFMTPSEIRERYGVHRKVIGGGWLKLRAGKVTDDTEMSLCIARAILLAGRWDLLQVATQFVSWMRSKPLDIGATCRRGIRDYMLFGRTEQPESEWDAGNGAAMRVGPVSLFTLGDDELLQKHVVEQARLTHNNPLSDAACITAGRMIQLAILGHSKNRLHDQARELFRAFPQFRFDPYDGQASGYVVHTLRTVFHFFFTSRSFEDCLVGVVNQGGDADTTGSIAGLIAGAFYGPEEIPSSWTRKLDPAVQQEIISSAGRLVRLSPLGENIVRPDSNQA